MAIRNILGDKSDILRKKSREVTDFNKRLHELLDDLAETMYNSGGVGLAAPQVGILRRAAVIDVGDGLIELVNPEIISQKGESTDREGCLSFPSLFGDVVRPARVTVLAYDRKGDRIRIRGNDYLARALCHEIDHLNGILFVDLAKDLRIQKDE